MLTNNTINNATTTIVEYATDNELELIIEELKQEKQRRTQSIKRVLLDTCPSCGSHALSHRVEDKTTLSYCHACGYIQSITNQGMGVRHGSTPCYPLSSTQTSCQYNTIMSTVTRSARQTMMKITLMCSTQKDYLIIIGEKNQMTVTTILQALGLLTLFTPIDEIIICVLISVVVSFIRRCRNENQKVQ